VVQRVVGSPSTAWAGGEVEDEDDDDDDEAEDDDDDGWWLRGRGASSHDAASARAAMPSQILDVRLLSMVAPRGSDEGCWTNQQGFIATGTWTLRHVVLF
jgi:hypothetical protein